MNGNGLNPFEFRAGIYFWTLTRQGSMACLNPFEFRAGIYFYWTSWTMCQKKSLNPFEFRAGIYLPYTPNLQNANTVLIPLNSGLVFTSSLSRAPTRAPSLNPFEFRAGIYFRACLTCSNLGSLNPFEFRAGIYFVLPISLRRRL